MRHAGETELVRFGAGSVELEGDLYAPRRPAGVVLFAHGNGSSRRSSRNRFVAGELQAAGLATLLMDHPRFDILLLAGRLVAATRWLGEEPARPGR